MTISTSEIETLRFHLQYGNMQVGAEPYTPDGFQALFTQVIAPNLGISTETTSVTDVTAAAQNTIVVGDATLFAAYGTMVVGVGDAAEIVQIATVSGTSITGYFVNAHTGPYPVALMSGTARLRMLLHEADAAHAKLTDQEVVASAGLKQVDKGDVEWFNGSGGVLKDRQKHYLSIVGSIASLVRVDINRSGCRGRIEAY